MKVETPKNPPSVHLEPFTPYQKGVVAILAFLQFTIILDFMILSPLGAIVIPSLHIDAQQFGLVVSAYAFAAGTSGFLAAGFADRFDRKKLLLFFYCGFVLGTFLCALAPNFRFLLMARLVTGVFGGVIGSIVFAITTDLFSYEKRGRVMGIIQTAFAASQVMGIPAGLYFSNLWNWHAPFFLIASIGLVAGAVLVFYLKPINAHLKLHPDRQPIHHLISTITDRRHLEAFATVTLLSTGGFMLMPFASAFTVHNLGIDLDHLPTLYMITGLCAIFTGPLVGRLSDRFSKYSVYAAGALLSIVMVAIYTSLGLTPLWLAIIVNAVLFIGISARMISSQALMSAIPAPENRGSFMSVNSSVAQISGGIASAIAGAIVTIAADGSIQHFNVLGYCVIGATIVAIGMMYRLNQLVNQSQAKK